MTIYSFTSAREIEHYLYYVPTSIRNLADITFLNTLRLTYKFAKVSGATPAELEVLRIQFRDFADKLIVTQAPGYSGDTENAVLYTHNEEIFITALVITGAAAFPLAIASYMAGYTLLAVASAAICWVGISPLLIQPSKLPIMIHEEFSSNPVIFSRKAANRVLGFFSSFTSSNTTAESSPTTRNRNYGA